MTRDTLSDLAAPTALAARPARARRRDGPGVRILAVVTALAVLVSVAGYAAGRAASPGFERSPERRVERGGEPGAERAPERAAARGPTDAPEGEEARGADVATATIPDRPDPEAVFEDAARRPTVGGDLSLLRPEVAEAVREARRLRTAAEAAERRALRSAERARTAGVSGTGASATGASETGTGVEVFANGDRYEGDMVDGVRDGVGVYTWANALEGTYAGEFVDGAIAGLGVKRWADGAAYYGSRSREAREGYGVFAYADGGGYEGEWAMGAPDGHGVVWTPEGTVKSQGVWAANVLVEAWITPAPVATADTSPTPVAAGDEG